MEVSNYENWSDWSWNHGQTDGEKYPEGRLHRPAGQRSEYRCCRRGRSGWRQVRYQQRDRRELRCCSDHAAELPSCKERYAGRKRCCRLHEAGHCIH